MSRKKPQNPQAYAELISGIVDAIVEQPETQSAFEKWYEIITAEAAKARKSVPAKVRKTSSTSYTWIRASIKQWQPRIQVSIIRLIRSFGFPPLSDGEILLPSGIMFLSLINHRFQQYAVARGKWPWRRGPSLKTILESEPIGEEFKFTIPADWSLRRVRAALQDRLPEFVARIKEKVRFVEENQWLRPPPRKPGRFDKGSLHRDGRWLFLVEVGRAKKEDLAQSYHKEHGDRHDEESPWPCDSCQRNVNDRLSNARHLFEPARTSPY